MSADTKRICRYKDMPVGGRSRCTSGDLSAPMALLRGETHKIVHGFAHTSSDLVVHERYLRVHSIEDALEFGGINRISSWNTVLVVT